MTTKEKHTKKPKIDSVKGDYRIRRDESVQPTPDELFYIVVQFHRKNPELSRAILSALKNETPYYRINCPFPFSCNAFPCKRLHCNADVCDNGYAYRMS